MPDLLSGTRATKKLCFFAVLFVFAFASVAKADDLFNNLSATPSGLTTFTNSFLDPSSNPQLLAASFSTGASAFNFSSLTVALMGAPTIASVFLLSDASDSPGTVLGGFSAAINPSPIQVQDIPLDPAGGFSFFLAPNTRYWIELSITAPEIWSFTQDTTGTGVAGEFSAYRPNPYLPVSVSPWIVSPNTVGPFQMEVAGTAAPQPVPEPSTLLLFASGLLGVAAAAFWRRKEVASHGV